MRHFTLATGFALATAVMLSVGTARAATSGGAADFGGLAEDGKGMCRQYNGNSVNNSYYYWGKCPGQEQHRGGAGVRPNHAGHHGKKEG
jgi:hypothetical protein